MTKPLPPDAPRQKPGPKPGSKPETERIGGLRLPVALRGRLRALALKAGVSESEAIRRAVSQWACDGEGHDGAPCWCGQGGPP